MTGRIGFGVMFAAIVLGIAVLPAAAADRTDRNHAAPVDVLMDVDAVRGHATAVGFRYGPGGEESPAVQRWNGTRWRQIDLPEVGAGGLSGVATTGRDYTVAVGLTAEGHRLVPLVMESTGSGWTEVGGLGVGPHSAYLSGVDATGPDTVFAVGGGNGGALVIRGDGTAWSRMAVPAPTQGQVTLTGVEIRSPHDVWAVGYRTDVALRTYAVHFDGESWTEVPTPNRGPGDNILLRVVASNGTVYAVGSAVVNGVERALVMRYDGNWSLVPTVRSGADSALSDVDARGGTVVAVGRSGEGVLIQRFDGNTWKIESSAELNGIGVPASGVAVAASGEAHAVGGSLGPDGKAKSGKRATYRFDGRRWVIA